MELNFAKRSHTAFSCFLFFAFNDDDDYENINCDHSVGDGDKNQQMTMRIEKKSLGEIRKFDLESYPTPFFRKKTPYIFHTDEGVT